MARLKSVGPHLHIAGCPNACRHCGDNGRPPFGALMSVEDARWVLERFRAVADTLCPCVGFELTAHPEMVALWELSQEFSNDPDMDWSVLSTNGYGIANAEDPEALLRRFAASGVRMLSFTLHGEREHHDWFVCRPGAFDDIWQTARCAAQLGLDTGFNFYVDRRNAADLEPFLERAVRLHDETGVQVETSAPILVLFWANARLRVYERTLRPRPADLEPIRDHLVARWGGELEDFTEGTWVRRLLDPADPLPRPQKPRRDTQAPTFIVDGSFNVYERPPLSEYTPVLHGNMRAEGLDAIIDRCQAWEPPDYPDVTELAGLYGDRGSDLLHRNPTSLYVKWIDRWLAEHGGMPTGPGGTRKVR